MRLVVYTDNVELGGADLSLMHLLARLDPTIEVAILAVAERIAERLASARPTATVRLVPRPQTGHDVASLRAHASALRALRPDIVHANLSSPWSCQYVVAAAAFLRTPHVVNVYQLVVPPISERQRRAKRLTARYVERHVGVGERTAREVEVVVGLRPGSVATIHNGVPDETLQVERSRLRRPVIGTVGRLEQQKGFDVLLRALVDVPDVTLRIVGDGSERLALQRLAEALGIAGRVEWVGWSDRPREDLAAFDVFVLSSRFEGFPLVVLEALLGEVAVVATDVGSVREVIVDGRTGLLVRPDDPRQLALALQRMLGDADLRLRSAGEGRRLVLRRFTAEAMTRRFEALYDELLSHRR